MHVHGVYTKSHD